MKRATLLMLAAIAIGCGGSGGDGGTPPPPPPPGELNFAPPGEYSGTIDWDGNDRPCRITVHGTDGVPNGNTSLYLSGTGGLPGTLIQKKLSYIDNKVVSITETLQGVRIFYSEFGNTRVNVIGPE